VTFYITLLIKGLPVCLHIVYRHPRKVTRLRIRHT